MDMKSDTSAVQILVGERLKEAMIHRGYSASMLAKESGISLSTILNFVHGRRQMHLDDMQKIGSALQTSPGWIAWGK